MRKVLFRTLAALRTLFFLVFSRDYAREKLRETMMVLCYSYFDDHWIEGVEYSLFEAMKTGSFGRFRLQPKERRTLRFYYFLSGLRWWHLPESSDEIHLIGPREWRTLVSLVGKTAPEPQPGSVGFRAH